MVIGAFRLWLLAALSPGLGDPGLGASPGTGVLEY